MSRFLLTNPLAKRAIWVKVNPAYKARELEHTLKQSGQKMLFLARRFRTTDYTDLLGEVRHRCEALE